MGIPVLILGESGSGKSTSLRNFKPEDIAVLNVASKPLPFPAKLKTVNTSDYNTIAKALSSGKFKSYAIDDSQYLMAFDFLDRSKETGYQKFTDLALSFSGLIRFIASSTPPDTLVYFLHHTEKTDDGRTKAKTIGKMLDEKLTVEGLFSIVLICKTDGTRHYFETQSDGFTTAKSPMEMFDREIDNDLKFVDTRIREYWGLNNAEA